VTAELALLLELLYNAHRSVDAMYVELRDWHVPEASKVLIVETDSVRGRRARWAAGGLYPRPSESTRQVWFQRPDRTRVEILQDGSVMRSAVRNGTAWWRWDRDDGETAGDLAQGGGLPPILDLTLLHPANLLHTMWFEVTGPATRAHREVLKATGEPRENPARATGYVDFEFDREHGTPLHIARFEDGECVRATEALSVDYRVEIDPAVFGFERSDRDRPSASRARRLRRQATPRPSERRLAAIPHSGLVMGKTIWLTGLSGAGKTTIARDAERLLRQLGATCYVLDDDALRLGLSMDLGLSRADHFEQARRVAHVAAMLADSGVIAIVALGSPYADDREQARQIHNAAGLGFLEVWVDTPLAICESRDIKGLYAAAHARDPAPRANSGLGGSGPTGVTAPYETPPSPDLRVSGHDQHPRVSAEQIVEEVFSETDRAQVLLPHRA
jgi:adenylylsulfate kinase